LNANGPTINCIGIRETGARGELEVFFRWFHFLGGEDYCLGYANPREDEFRDDFNEIIRHAFVLEAGYGLRRFALVTGVPHVVVPWAEETWIPGLRDALVSSRAIQQADWGREQYLLAKYGSQLFPRAGEETREGYEHAKADGTNLNEAGQEMLDLLYRRHEHIPSFRDWQPGQYQSRGLVDGDIDTWWATVTNETFWPAAAVQVAQAWVGAIAQSNLEVKTPLEEVRDFFTEFSFPWWTDNMRTDDLRQSMGLSDEQ
jgi:hypothetical protein